MQRKKSKGVLTKKLIPLMSERKIGQKILEIGPKWHKSKEGTPTMGGVSFLISMLIAYLAVLALYGNEMERNNLILLANIFIYGLLNGAVGLIDDLAKYRKQKNEGLTPKGKLIFQSIIAVLFLVSVEISTGISTVVKIPFTAYEWDMGFFYYVVAFFMLCGITNAVNLTDGLDGLASTCVLSVGVLFSVIGFLLHTEGTFSFFGGALMGICIGFLIYNLHPAKIFMGDTGSLFLGAIIVSAGIATNNPLATIVYSMVFIVEAISVILQVAYFKITKGKRLLKMAPMHHHFEKCGLSEMKIVSVFGVASALFSVAAYFCAL